MTLQVEVVGRKRVEFGALKPGELFECSGSVYVKADECPLAMCSCQRELACGHCGKPWQPPNVFNLTTKRFGLYKPMTEVYLLESEPLKVWRAGN